MTRSIICPCCNNEIVMTVYAQELQKSNEPTVDLETIITIVTDHYKVKLSEMRSKTRKKEIVLARQVAIYLATEYTRLSLIALGKYFVMDRTSIDYSAHKIESYLTIYTDLADEIKLLRSRCEARLVSETANRTKS